MKVRTEISLLVAGMVVSSLLLSAWIQSTLFARDKETYVNDQLATVATARASQIRDRIEFLYMEMGELAARDKIHFGEKYTSIAGMEGVAVWKKGKRVLAEGALSQVATAPDGESDWALIPQDDGGVHWVTRFSDHVVLTAFSKQWLRQLLPGSFGADVALVSGERAAVRDLASSSSTRTLRFEQKGKEFLGAYVSLGTEPPSGVLVSSPSHVVSGLTSSVYWRTFGIALVFLLVSLVLGSLLAGRLTKPLSALEKQTLKISEGDFSEQVSAALGSHNEIGTLARCFNTMSGKLAQLRDRIAKTERLSAFGEFSAAIAHEVKNPLAGIIAISDVSQRMFQEAQVDTPVLVENFKLIGEEAKRANAIISRLMQFCRQDGGPMGSVDLVMQSVRWKSTLAPLAAQAGVEVEVNVENPSLFVRGNADELHQVIQNLCQNALHAMKSATTKRLRVVLRADDNYAIVSVADTGTGMPENVRKKIFEPFFTTKPIGEGTGLGLSVCHGIVVRHRGTIDVVSAPGEGTEFFIRLPMA